jgi:pimeloyl-ACP methyl ester carboxylesterase
MHYRRIDAPAPHVNLGGAGPLLHFSHANGFPPLAYRALLQPFLESHEVIASLHRPLWQPSPAPSSLGSWQIFADDLIQLLQQFDQPVTSIGHSMGAAAILLAASKRPELFKSIILIEPVLVPRRFLLLLHFFGRFSRETIPLVRKTLARVDRWSTPLQAFQHFRPKTVFRNISDDVLWDYIEHGVGEIDGEACRLTYSKEWEAHCYTKVHNLWNLLAKVSVPLLAIRGQDSDTIIHSAWQKWRLMSPTHTFLDIPDAGHLLPFEKPDSLAMTIKAWLAEPTSI